MQQLYTISQILSFCFLKSISYPPQINSKEPFAFMFTKPYPKHSIRFIKRNLCHGQCITIISIVPTPATAVHIIKAIEPAVGNSSKGLNLYWPAAEFLALSIHPKIEYKRHSVYSVYIN